MVRTQVLITGIGKGMFDRKWPKLLEKEFKDRLPHIEPLHFTPLTFLNRIVIVLRNEEEAVELYEWMKAKVLDLDREEEKCNNDGLVLKVYLTEPIVGKPHSLSASTAGSNGIRNSLTSAETIENGTQNGSEEAIGIDDNNNGNVCNEYGYGYEFSQVVGQYGETSEPGLEGTPDPSGRLGRTRKRPSLKIDVSVASRDGGSSRAASSPTLSPDRQISPTLIKFPDDGKFHYYMEPAPERAPLCQNGFSAPVWADGTRYLFRGSKSSSPLNTESPVSPSITLDQCKIGD